MHTNTTTNNNPADFQYHRIPHALFPGPYFKNNYFEGETHGAVVALAMMM